MRMFGLGDVLMALCAAKAIKACTGAWVLLITGPSNLEIAMACPHVDQVICGPSEIESARDILAGSDKSVWQLGSPGFAIARQHQVDAYVDAIGIVATSEQKEL
ncbi:MAG: hypothetical protein IPM02_18230 [Betaproteobacteria bacterium]|nr:hypothetical protein [Betaproteobacteria bacterium]